VVEVGPNVGTDVGKTVTGGDGTDPYPLAAAQRPLPKIFASLFGVFMTESDSQLAIYVGQQNCSHAPQR
jgi:hypothetical protein